MVDLYGYKFRYNFKKYETVTYNKVIFKSKPFPFNMSKVRVAIEVQDEFIGIDGIRQWWNWWEIVPNNKFNRIVYWIKFYTWYFTKFKRL